MNILGISGFYHDSAAVLLKDGEIVAAAQEERFTRKKHDSAFPSNAVAYCLEAGGITAYHILYGARDDQVAVVTRVEGDLVPLVYPVEPLIDRILR